MKYIFVVTSFFIALVNVKDLYHSLAKEWGLTDCYSFKIMEENKILKALTADIYFKQFGMDILLK